MSGRNEPLSRPITPVLLRPFAGGGHLCRALAGWQLLGAGGLYPRAAGCRARRQVVAVDRDPLAVRDGAGLAGDYE